jgi:hypothetical protein
VFVFCFNDDPIMAFLSFGLSWRYGALFYYFMQADGDIGSAIRPSKGDLS